MSTLNRHRHTGAKPADPARLAPEAIAVESASRAKSALDWIEAILRPVLTRALVSGYYGNVQLKVVVQNGQMVHIEKIEGQTHKPPGETEGRPAA